MLGSIATSFLSFEDKVWCPCYYQPAMTINLGICSCKIPVSCSCTTSKKLLVNAALKSGWTLTREQSIWQLDLH